MKETKWWRWGKEDTASTEGRKPVLIEQLPFIMYLHIQMRVF